MIDLEPVRSNAGSVPPIIPSAKFRTHRISVGGLSIAAILEPGRERPVVFLHGNSSSKDVWANQIDFARRHGRAVLAPDLPGHGESDDSATPEATYCMPGYAGVIRGLLDAMQWTGVDVVGWSLGGHIALELLATDPRIASLLIVGTPPGPPCREAIELAFHPSVEMHLAGKPNFTLAEAKAYAMAMMGGEDFLTPGLLAAVERTDGRARGYLFASVKSCIGYDHLSLVERVETPLCVVHGEWEPFVRLEYLRSINYRALWNDRIYLISRAGHAPHWQTPDAFNLVLFKFLNFAARAGAIAHVG